MHGGRAGCALEVVAIPVAAADGHVRAASWALVEGE